MPDPTRVFHVGFVVPRIEEAMDQFGEALGLRWRPVFEGMFQSGDRRFPVRSVYTIEGPPAVELLEAVPGTVLDSQRGGVEFHHLGWWVDDLAGEAAHLEAQGWPIEGGMVGRDGAPRRVAMHRSPWEFCIELLDLGLDWELIKDLYPPDRNAPAS